MTLDTESETLEIQERVPGTQFFSLFIKIPEL